MSLAYFLAFFLLKFFTLSESKLYEPGFAENSITSNVTCNGNACLITNACVSSNTGLKLFGENDHVYNESLKLKYIVKQNYACSHDQCRVPTTQGYGKPFFHNAIATLATGLHNYNCGHQLGDV